MALLNSEVNAAKTSFREASLSVVPTLPFFALPLPFCQRLMALRVLLQLRNRATYRDDAPIWYDVALISFTEGEARTSAV